MGGLFTYIGMVLFCSISLVALARIAVFTSTSGQRKRAPSRHGPTPKNGPTHNPQSPAHNNGSGHPQRRSTKPQAAILRSAIAGSAPGYKMEKKAGEQKALRELFSNDYYGSNIGGEFGSHTLPHHDLDESVEKISNADNYIIETSIITEAHSVDIDTMSNPASISDNFSNMSSLYDTDISEDEADSDFKDEISSLYDTDTSEDEVSSLFDTDTSEDEVSSLYDTDTSEGEVSSLYDTDTSEDEADSDFDSISNDSSGNASSFFESDAGWTYDNNDSSGNFASIGDSTDESSADDGYGFGDNDDSPGIDYSDDGGSFSDDDAGGDSDGGDE